MINFKNDNKNEENEAQENKVENVRKEITNGFDTSDIDGGKDIVIQEKDITITISRNDNQKNQITALFVLMPIHLILPILKFIFKYIFLL